MIKDCEGCHGNFDGTKVQRECPSCREITKNKKANQKWVNKVPRKKPRPWSYFCSDYQCIKKVVRTPRDVFKDFN